jgi:uncharacterized protein with ParB-like and HNH nuclease domain
MDARARKVGEILHASDQYLIPFFQRNYSWVKANWDRLWNDLTTLIEDQSQSQHFLGPLVCTPTSHVPSRVAGYLLIDGQQRLTSLILLLTGLRDVAHSYNLTDISEEITEDYLIHKRKEGLERYKVIPRLGDRTVLVSLIEGKSTATFNDFQIIKAYKYFRRRVEQVLRGNSDKEGDVLKDWLTVITSRLALVVITIDQENPYEIFDSLNSTGLPLEEADLIRNHVFMRVPLEQQEQFNTEVWSKFEESFPPGDDNAKSQTVFYRNYLMSYGVYVKLNQTFVEFRKQYQEKGLVPESQVHSMMEYLGYSRQIDQPGRCSEPWLRSELENLQLLDVNTAHPLLFALFQQYSTGRLDKCC